MLLTLSAISVNGKRKPVNPNQTREHWIQRITVGLPDLPYFTPSRELPYSGHFSRLPFETNTGDIFSRILTSLNIVACVSNIAKLRKPGFRALNIPAQNII